VKNRGGSSKEAVGEVTRRGFLRACGTAVIAYIGALPLVTHVREALAAAPVWTQIPNQNWQVGVPVNVDLASYCTDADGDRLTFTLDRPLPPGVTLNGSVISGTPSAPFSATSFIATADDADSVPPAAIKDLRDG
jgi:hypothetical protein